jgi:protein-tyrosine phosphatase
MLTEVHPKLYVGNIFDAEFFDGIVCCVLEKNSAIYFDGSKKKIRDDALSFPVFNDTIFQFDIIQLELLSRFVGRTLKNYNEKVIIHCGMGWERSPFSMAYVLWRNYEEEFPSLSIAYEYVKKVHIETKNVANWIPKWWKNLYFPSKLDRFNKESE